MSAFDTFLYYIFHFIYLGEPMKILDQLCMALELEEGDERDTYPWDEFYESMREGCKTASLLAALVAASAAALLSVERYAAYELTRTLLLATLTTSLLGAMYCISFLSIVVSDPTAFKTRWQDTGMIFVIQLSGPGALLRISFWTLRAAILSIVWLSEGRASQITLTAILGASFTLVFLLDYMSRMRDPNLNRSPLRGLILDLIGSGEDVNHSRANIHSRHTEDEFENGEGKFYVQDSSGPVSGTHKSPSPIWRTLARTPVDNHFDPAPRQSFVGKLKNSFSPANLEAATIDSEVAKSDDSDRRPGQQFNMSSRPQSEPERAERGKGERGGKKRGTGRGGSKSQSEHDVGATGTASRKS